MPGEDGAGGAAVVGCWPLFQQRALLVQSGPQSGRCTVTGSAGLRCLLESEPLGAAERGQAVPFVCNRRLEEDWEELSEYPRNIMVSPLLQDEALFLHS